MGRSMVMDFAMVDLPSQAKANSTSRWFWRPSIGSLHWLPDPRLRRPPKVAASHSSCLFPIACRSIATSVLDIHENRGRGARVILTALRQHSLTDLIDRHGIVPEGRDGLRTTHAALAGWEDVGGLLQPNDA